MINSPRRAISYPVAARTDIPDIPLHIKNLVDKLDLDVEFRSGLAAALFAPAMAGRVYWATDTAELWLDIGTGLVKIYPQTALADGSVTTAKLAANAVTAAKILDGAITTSKLADGSVTNNKVSADTLTAIAIAANAIGVSELADGAVDTAAIQDGAVTPAKMSVRLDRGIGVSFNANIAVGFATPFSAPPVVVPGLMVGNPAANGGAGEPANYTAWVDNITAAGFNLFHNQGGTRTVPWHAIGS